MVSSLSHPLITFLQVDEYKFKDTLDQVMSKLSVLPDQMQSQLQDIDAKHRYLHALKKAEGALPATTQQPEPAAVAPAAAATAAPSSASMVGTAAETKRGETGAASL